MKAKHHRPILTRGFTLIELTFTIAILLTLVTVTMFASHRYLYQANRAGCLMNQDAIRKVLISNANLKDQTFKSGVDYCAAEDANELFEHQPVCPDGGGYSAKLDAGGEHLEIVCKLHGDDHK